MLVKALFPLVVRCKYCILEDITTFYTEKRTFLLAFLHHAFPLGLIVRIEHILVLIELSYRCEDFTCVCSNYRARF
jgi:hypothetical protein